MYIFFLIINLVFAGVFFIFWSYLETIIFLFIWILMFFYFSPMYFKNKWNKESIISKFSISKETIKKTIPLFHKVSYLIAFSFFYLSLYWISYNFWGTLFPYLILIISLSVIIIFFLTIKKQKTIINLIFRYNFLILSLIIILTFVYKFYYNSNINSIFIINSILSYIGLWIIITLDKIVNNIKKQLFYTYFLIYFLFILIFYIQYYFKFNYILLLSYIGFIMSIFYFDIISKIKYLKNYDDISKYFWIFLSYLVFITSGILLFIFPNFWHFVLIITGLIMFHYYVHYLFKNYISLVIVIFWISLIYIKNFIEIWLWNYILFLIFIYLLPFVYLGYTFVFENKYQYDHYFILFFGILFSIIAIIVYYFKFQEFNILNTSIIFLLQSLLLFWSFTKLKDN